MSGLDVIVCGTCGHVKYPSEECFTCRVFKDVKK